MSRSFSWAHWGLWGPVPTVTVLKEGAQSGVTFDLPLRTHLLSDEPQWGPPVPLKPFLPSVYPFLTPRPRLSSVENILRPWNRSRTADVLFLLRQMLHPCREGEPIWGCGPEAEEFRPEAWPAGEQQILEHHGQEGKLPASGMSISVRQGWLFRGQREPYTTFHLLSLRHSQALCLEMRSWDIHGYCRLCWL